MPWEDAHRLFKWTVPEGAEWGLQWLEYPRVEGAHLSGCLIALPSGHTRTVTEDGDAVLYGIEGEIEVVVGNGRSVLRRFDLLSIPAGMQYSCVNMGLSTAVVCGIFADGKGLEAVSKHLSWREYRRDFQWTLPLADQFGYHRASGPFLDTGTLRAHTAWQLSGQSTPWHFAPRDLLFVGTHNDVEFNAAGRQWPLSPFDLLLMPAETPYTYTNYGFTEAVFLSIGGKAPPGRTGAYFSADPGWPARADAKRLSTETDIYGNARVKGA